MLHRTCVQSDYAVLYQKRQNLYSSIARASRGTPSLHVHVHAHAHAHMHICTKQQILPAGITHGDRFMAATADGKTVELECPENGKTRTADCVHG